jgi:excisionase family DNA binding protein
VIEVSQKESPYSFKVKQQLKEGRALISEYKRLSSSDIPVEVKLLQDKLGGQTYFLTSTEAAIFFKVSTRTIFRWIERGDLRSYRFGNKHAIPLFGVVELLNARDTFYE